MGQNQHISLESAELLTTREESTMMAKLRPMAKGLVAMLPSVKDTRKGRSHSKQWKTLFVVLGILIALASDPAAIALGVGIATMVFWLPLPAIYKRGLQMKIQKMGTRQVKTWEPILLEIRKDHLFAKRGKEQLFRVPLKEVIKSDDGFRRKASDLLIRDKAPGESATTTIRIDDDDLLKLESFCLNSVFPEI